MRPLTAPQSKPEPVRKDRSYRIIARIAASICILIGGAAFAGWTFDLHWLTDFLNTGVRMKANTGLAMALAGAALLLLLPLGASAARRNAGFAIAAVVAAVGGLTLSEHIFGWNLGIDELLIAEPPGQAATVSPGRMGPPASTCYLLGGLALLLSHGSRRRQLVSQALAIAIGAIAMLSILGSLYGAKPLYTIAQYTGISPQTSWGFLMLCIGLLCARPRRGVMAVLSSDDVGGVLMRRLLLPLLVLIILMARLRMFGEDAGWYDEGFGASVFALGMLTLLAALVTWTALKLNRLSAMRSRAESDLHEQNEHLRTLCGLSDAVSRAATVRDICQLALDELMIALKADRASVLLFDADGVMRFKAWRGLSDSYRAAVEGHSPWKQDARDPQPVTIDDVDQSEPLRPLRDTIVGEGIHALAFIPLVDDRRLLGKFMVYYDHPHAFTAKELAVARAVAASVAFSINRASSDQATARLAAIVESSEDAIFSKDLNGIIHSWNAGAEQLFGYTHQEAVGQPVTLLVPPDRHAEEAEILARLRRGERIDQYETVRVSKSGQCMDVSLSVSPLRDRSGTIIGASSVVRDITARKASEKAHQALDRQLRIELAATQRLHDISTRFVHAGDIQAVFQELLDVAVAIMHSDMASMQMVDDAENALRLLAWRGFGPEFGEAFGMVRPDAKTSCSQARNIGERVIVPDVDTCDVLKGTSALEDLHRRGIRAMQSTPLLSRSGRMLGMISTHWRVPHSPSQDELRLLDILARQAADLIEGARSEEALRYHAERLEELVGERTMELERTHERLRLSERMAALGTLAAGLGHDMGNLLLPVRVRLQGLQSMPLGQEACDHLSVVNNCIGYLQNLAKGLRLFALDPNVTDVSDTTNLHEWRAQVESFFRSALPRDVRFEWSLPESLPHVRVARHALTQAVYNLVQNAGDATRDRADGVVRVWIDASADGRAVRLGVSDNGIGMSPQVKRRCLEPFFTTKTRGLSTGLGLSLMHGIVQRCGGSVDIETEPDKGTTFIMTLPACSQQASDEHRRSGRVAAVSLPDRRMSAFITALLRALRFDVQAEPPSPDIPAAIWVLSDENGGLAQAESFVHANPAAHALVIGTTSNGPDIPTQITVIERGAPLTQVQQALRAIAAAIHNAAPNAAPSNQRSPRAMTAGTSYPEPDSALSIR